MTLVSSSMRLKTPVNLKILVLDGGDSKCLSQLEILRHLLHRVEVDTGEPCLPCEYFDLIVASGAGGVIGILLAVLRLTVQDAMDVFGSLCSQVFPAEGCTPAARSDLLDLAINKLLTTHNIPSNASFESTTASGFVGSCRLAIGYLSAVNIAACRLLRNYPTRYAPTNMTIAQAIRLSWATPGLFLPVMFGPEESRAEELVSCVHGYNNPSLVAIKEAFELFGADARVSSLLSLGSGKAAIRSLGATESTATSTLDQLAVDCEATAQEVQRRVGSLGIYFRFSVEHGLEFTQPGGRMDEIVSHTIAYINEDAVNNAMDACLRIADSPSTITLEQISRARARGVVSSGLPPLSAFYVPRPAIMQAMVSKLLEPKERGQRVMIISGLGGSGKTQCVLKFCREHEDSYQHIFFIDASSAESIKSGLLTRVRALGREYAYQAVEDVLRLLVCPDSLVTRRWLLVFDNADSNLDLDIRDYFPECEHGSILVTTRNMNLGALSPRGHLKLDVMSSSEAINTLLAAAMEPGVTPREDEEEIAGDIVKQLGYLPVAIVQAGCYIKSQHCLRQYTMRLKHNRRKLLDRPARTREKLKYDHSVYAAFDVTLDALSNKARQLLTILSMVHYADFPQSLICAAAKSHFEFEMCQLFDRPTEHQDTIKFLRDLFCPEEMFEEDDLVDILDELQQYSLVSLVSTDSTITLRLHPLVHSWARDRMAPEETKTYRDAAIRLLASVANWDNISLFPYLSTHVRTLVTSWDELHPNDAVAFAQFLGYDDDCETRLKVLSEVHHKIRSLYGDKDIRTSRIALELADAYGDVQNEQKMEEMEREIVSTREELLGRDHLETLAALANLAATLNDKEDYEGSLVLREEVLSTAIRTTGPSSRCSADAMEALAGTYNCLSRFEDEEKLLVSAHNIFKELLGETHQYTIDVMVDLSECYGSQGRHDEAVKLQREVLRLERSAHGMHSEGTISTLEWIAKTMMDQKQYSAAEDLWLQAIQTRSLMKTPDKATIADDMSWLARAYRQQRKFADAEALSRDELNLRAEMQEDSSAAYCDALSWLCRELQDQEKYDELPSLTDELLKKRRAIFGDDHLSTCTALGWRGITYFYQGKHKQAEEMRREEFEKRKQLQGVSAIEVWSAASWLGRALYHQQRYYDAEVVRREELAARRKITGDKDSEYLTSLSWLIQSLIDQVKVADIDDLTTELLNSRIETAGPKAPETLLAKQYKARARMLEGRSQEALDMLLSLLPEQAEVLGAESHPYLNTMRYIAQAEYELGHIAEALRRRLEEVTARNQVQGENSSEYLSSLSWVVKCLFELEKWSEMEDHANDLVRGRLVLSGEGHQDTLDARLWLARAYFHGAKYDQAEITFAKLGEDWMTLKGSNNNHTVDCLDWSSRIYQAQYRWEEAIRLREKEIEARKSWNEPTNEALVSAQSWLVQLLGELGRWDEMEKLASSVVEDRKKIMSTPLNLLSAKQWLARAYFENEKYDQALEVLESVVQGRLEEQGKAHVDYLNTVAFLSRVLWVLGRLDEAERMYREELEMRVAAQGETEAAVRDSTSWLVRVLASIGRYDEARILATENFDKALRNQTAGSLTTLRSQLALVEVLMKEKAWYQAVPILQDLLENAQPSTSAQDPVIIPSATMRLARCYHELGDTDLAYPLAKEAAPLLSRRLKTKSPNTQDLREFMELVEAGVLDSQQPTSGPVDKAVSHQVPTVETLGDVDEEAAPDPDDVETAAGSPAPQAAPGPSISRQLTPFSQRESFGRRPNNWSMFF